MKIASLPQIMGRSRTELGSDLRSVTEGSYLIIFRHTEERLEIISFVEGHCDVEPLFGGEDPP